MYIKRQKCYFDGDTLIETDQGAIKIKDIVDNKLPCKVVSLEWDGEECDCKEVYYDIVAYHKKELTKPCQGIEPHFTSRELRKKFSVICTEGVSFEFDYIAALSEYGYVPIANLESMIRESRGKFVHPVYSDKNYDENAQYAFKKRRNLVGTIYNITLSDADATMFANGIAVLGQNKED